MSTEENLSCVLYAKGDVRLVNTPIPEPRENEVQVSVCSVGICGSDVHYVTHGAIGKFVVKKAMILGHESSGVVTKLGASVQHLRVGDRVALEPGIPCRRCGHCLSGRYNLCADIVFCATPPHDGTLRRFYCQDAQFCYRLPPNVSLDEGALVEPLAVATHACRRAAIAPGQRVLITGAGPIGLLSLMVAKAFGASAVAITDLAESRLSVARSLGARASFNVSLPPAGAPQPATTASLADEIRAQLGAMPDATIECSGAESQIRLAIEATRPGGCVVLVGMGPPEVRVPFVEAGVKELDIRGLFRYANCYPTAIDLIASGRVNVKQLITHRFPLEEAVRAFEVTRTGDDGAIKVIIDCAPSHPSP